MKPLYEELIERIVCSKSPLRSFKAEFAYLDEGKRKGFVDFFIDSFNNNWVNEIIEEYSADNNLGVIGKLSADEARSNYIVEINSIREALSDHDLIVGVKNTDPLELRQKLILVFFLAKHGVLNLDLLHPDNTKRADILAPLLGRDYDAVRTGIGRWMNKEEKEFDKRDLQIIRELFAKWKSSPILRDLDELLAS